MYIICNEEALLMAEALVTIDQTAPNLRKELGRKESLHEKFDSEILGAQREIEAMKAMIWATWW
jgi:hypothetical protein